MQISNLDKTREINIKQTVEKAKSKLVAIEHYIDTGNADFPLPERKTFGFSWFCELETEELHPIARNAKCLKDSELRVEINKILRLAEQRLKADSSNTVENEVAKLKANNKLLKTQLIGLADEVERLLIERAELYSRLGLQQAQFKDASKLKGLR